MKPSTGYDLETTSKTLNKSNIPTRSLALDSSTTIGILLIASLTTAAPSPTVSSPPATQPPASPLQGNWRQDDGSTTVSIAPCIGSNALCATVIAERLQPGEASSLNTIIVRNIRPSGQSEWTGQFFSDTNQTMQAKLKLVTPNRFTVKVCAMAFVCEKINMERI
jgi:uncharacterized protein (DUF2147 family)